MFVVSSTFTHAQNGNGSSKFARGNRREKRSFDMPNPYSIDLRWRIVWIHLTQNLSMAEIASLVCVSERTAWRYVALFGQTGDVEPQQRKYGPTRLLGDLEQLTLLHLVLENHGIYLYEIQTKLENLFGARVSTATICRTLRFMGCSRQVMRRVAIQRSDALRARFMADISIYDPNMFVWLDETGCDRRNTLRKYGYSLRGIPICDHSLLVRGKRYSAIPVMSFTMCMSLKGPSMVTNLLILCTTASCLC